MAEVRSLADLSEEELLDFVEEQHSAARLAELEILRGAYQWAVVHNPDRLDGKESGKPGREKAKQLGGPGTPKVTEHAAAAFGARIGKSPFAAQRMIADALDIYLRLPELAARVEEGAVRVSYARHVADKTRELTEAEAGFVDAEVAESADGRLPWTRFEELVEAKVAAAAPELVRRREEQAQKATFAKKTRTEAGGMGTFMVRADIATINQIDAAVTAGATALEQAMPDSVQDERRVEALRRMTATGLDPAAVTPPTKQAVLYLHCFPDQMPGFNATDTDTTDAADTDTDHTPEPTRIARLEGHGPVTEAWIRRVLGPTAQFKVQPVLDLANQAPVDAYEIPRRHREAVHLMTPADIFPFAANTTRRKEIDHTTPYSQGGPSAVGNYGPMTKRHHRIKTHTSWQVRQPYPGIYLWRDLYGVHYLVDHTGTRRLPDTIVQPEPHRSVAEIHFTQVILDWAA